MSDIRIAAALERLEILERLTALERAVAELVARLDRLEHGDG